MAENEQTHFYDTEVASIMDAAETLLTQKNITYVFLVILDDSIVEHRHGPLPVGMKSLNVNVPKEGPAKVVPIPDMPVNDVVYGHVVEGQATETQEFEGNAIDFSAGK